MNIGQCIEQGLLKRAAPDIGKAEQSLKVSSARLAKAKKLLSAGFTDDAAVSAYAAMFHAARALLYRDGFKERSHYALYIYISEKYVDDMEPRFINELDSLREQRHELMYSLNPPQISESEARQIISVANDFASATKKMLGL